MAFPLLGAYDLLATQSFITGGGDFATSGDRYFGPNSSGGLTVGGSESTAKYFDTTPYRQILCFWGGAWTDVGVTMQVSMKFYPGLSSENGFEGPLGSTPALGGNVVLGAGVGMFLASASGGDSSIGADRKSYAPFVAPKMRIHLYNSAALVTALSNVALWIYGVRG